MASEKTKIAVSIRDLRKAHGETQKELGLAIHVEENTISMYESGKRQPDIQTIQAIAEHYGFPVDRLLSDVFSEMDFQMTTMTWEAMLAGLEIQFPIICTDTALQNTHFANGYRQTIRIWEKLHNPEESVLTSAFEYALEEYQSAYICDQNNAEAIANMLWLSFISYALLPDEHSEKMGKAILLGKSQKRDFVKKYVLKNANPISAQNEMNKKEYVRDSQGAIVELLRVLKSSQNYDDLADYYLGLRYVIGMVDNDYSADLNKTIGMEMLTSYASMGNKYALNLFRQIQSM